MSSLNLGILTEVHQKGSGARDYSFAQHRSSRRGEYHLLFPFFGVSLSGFFCWPEAGLGLTAPRSLPTATLYCRASLLSMEPIKFLVVVVGLDAIACPWQK